jgi:DeoR/GlpR family transcriptional regulator of sugar metabolism
MHVYHARMQTPLPLARRDVIAQRLAGGTAVVAATLALEFDVSEDAIRRDLRALAAEGRCRRVYGGALPVTPHTQPMFARIDESRGRKEALARRAAESIQAGEFLFLDAGSTNLALTEFLPEDQELTVATNSIDIAAAVLRRSDLRLIMVGGSVDATVGGCVDAAAVQAIAGFDVDRCFLGACAVDARGVGAALHADALFKRALMEVTRQCVVLALNEKFKARAPHRACALADIDLLVVEHDAPARLTDPLRAAGTAIARAACAT